MGNKLHACKACGHEIARTAKNCPHCGAKNKKGHPLLVGLLIFIVLVGIIGSMGENDSPTRVDDGPTTQINNSNSTTTPDASKGFKVGETAELNNITVSLVDVTESNGSAYNTPTDGNVFVLCEFEIANHSDAEINVSSALSFEAYCDGYTCTYSLSAILEKGNKNQLDGTVAPGKRFNGVIGYEVEGDWSELEIHFTPDVWSSKEIIFIANNE